MNSDREHLLPYPKNTVFNLLNDQKTVQRILDVGSQQISLSATESGISYSIPGNIIDITLAEDDGQTIIGWHATSEAPENFVRRILQELDLVTTTKGLPLYIWGAALTVFVIILLAWLYLSGANIPTTVMSDQIAPIDTQSAALRDL